MLIAQSRKSNYDGVLRHRSPERVHFVTGEYNAYGQPLWADRMWESGERAEYCRNVLQREPYAGES